METKRTRVGCFRLGCVLVLAVPLLVVVWCLTPRTTTLWLFGRRPTVAEHRKYLGGDRVVEILSKPDRAAAVLLNPPIRLEEIEGPVPAESGSDSEPATPPAPSKFWRANEYPVATEPIPVDPAIAAAISHILTNRGNFPDDGTRFGCLPVYGVRVSFFSAADRVDVYFCFECAMLAIYLNDQPVGGFRFDLPYRRLMAIVRKIFPDNERLAKLAREHTD